MRFIANFQATEKPPKEIQVEMDIQPEKIHENQEGEVGFSGSFKGIVSLVGRDGTKKIRDIKIESYARWTSDATTEEEFIKRVNITGGAHLLSLARNLIMTSTAHMGIKPMIIPLFNISASKEINWPKT